MKRSLPTPALYSQAQLHSWLLCSPQLCTVQAPRGWRVMVSPQLLPGIFPPHLLHLFQCGSSIPVRKHQTFPAAAWGPPRVPALLLSPGCRKISAPPPPLLTLGVCRAAPSPFSPHPCCLSDILDLFNSCFSSRHP